MAFTYTANPGGSSRDLVRLLLGDTNAAAPMCDDGEVAHALGDQRQDAHLAAAWLADRLAARFARDEAVSVDGISISGAGRAEAFRKLAANLRAEASRRATASGADGAPRVAGLVVTGLRNSDMAAAERDGDRPAPAFRREPAVPEWYQVLR